MIHTLKGFGIVNKAEVDVFLEVSCLFCDPADIGNLISGSSAFSKSSLNIWKFLIHILFTPCLEDFEHYFASVWVECHCVVVWTFFGVAFLWDWKQTLGGHKQNLVCTGTQEKIAMTPQETESDLPVSVQESLAEVWVNSGLPWGQGHWVQQSWVCWH